MRRSVADLREARYRAAGKDCYVRLFFLDFMQHNFLPSQLRLHSHLLGYTHPPLPNVLLREFEMLIFLLSQLFKISEEVVVDATDAGNIARLINHSVSYIHFISIL